MSLIQFINLRIHLNSNEVLFCQITNTALFIAQYIQNAKSILYDRDHFELITTSVKLIYLICPDI